MRTHSLFDVDDSNFPQLATASAAHGLVQRRILLVDDDVVLTRLLCDLLSERGVEVAVAHDAPGALRLAESFVPELILLDVGLPGGTGFDLCARWRRTSQAVIVFLSGGSLPRDRARGMAAGAADYITKPFVLEELLARICRALEQS
jgi:DNA-binding response OmpR family regulator